MYETFWKILDIYDSCTENLLFMAFNTFENFVQQMHPDNLWTFFDKFGRTGIFLKIFGSFLTNL